VSKKKRQGGVVPKALIGQESCTAEGERLCFAYNLGSCQHDGDCDMGKHLCCRKLCSKPHPFISEPALRLWKTNVEVRSAELSTYKYVSLETSALLEGMSVLSRIAISLGTPYLSTDRASQVTLYRLTCCVSCATVQ
jgi:hypothetical protein